MLFADGTDAMLANDRRMAIGSSVGSGEQGWPTAFAETDNAGEPDPCL
jgi:hypothetical protein